MEVSASFQRGGRRSVWIVLLPGSQKTACQFMNRFKRDRSQWTAVWLVAISCACSGCHVLELSGTKRIENQTDIEVRAASKKKDVRSADHAKEVTIQSTSFEEPAKDRSSTSIGSHGATPGELSISLAEAATTALSNNMHLRVIANMSEEVGKSADIAKAQFDTSFNTNAQYMQGTQQVTSCSKPFEVDCRNTVPHRLGPCPARQISCRQSSVFRPEPLPALGSVVTIT